MRQWSEFTSTWHLFVLELVADDEYPFYLFGKDLPISPGSHRQLSAKSSHCADAEWEAMGVCCDVGSNLSFTAKF